MPRKLATIMALATVAALAMTGCSASKNAVDQDSTYTFLAPGGKTQIFYDPPSTRGHAPNLAGDSLADPGHEIRLSDYPSDVLVVNIWGSWCAPCRRESPELEQVYRQTQASGVRFVGIDVQDSRSAAQDFRQEQGITYPSIHDPPGRSLLALQGYPRNVVPSTFILDRRHRVAAVFLQEVTAAQLLPAVRRIAAEPTAATRTPTR